MEYDKKQKLLNTMIKTIVLIGTHGSGKTTIGVKLASYLGCQFDSEIGKELRKKALKNNSKAYVYLSQPRFDQEVTFAELERDSNQNTKYPRVVETWHPGNLAYASVRSPEIMGFLYSMIENQVKSKQKEVLIQPLVISIETLKKRLTEVGEDSNKLANFLHLVGENSIEISHTLGLRVAPSISTDCISVNDTLNKIIEFLNSDFNFNFPEKY